jgi:hypothetical protein
MLSGGLEGAPEFVWIEVFPTEYKEGVELETPEPLNIILGASDFQPFPA